MKRSELVSMLLKTAKAVLKEKLVWKFEKAPKDPDYKYYEARTKNGIYTLAQEKDFPMIIELEYLPKSTISGDASLSKRFDGGITEAKRFCQRHSDDYANRTRRPER